MENATKALIIAGAILISILLVTMGITLLSGTNGLTKNNASKMSQIEVEEFNGQIEMGLGPNVRGSDVETMLKNVQAKFRDDEELKNSLTITYSGGDNNDIEAILGKVKSTLRYDVSEHTKNPDTGLYEKVDIKPKTTKP